MFKNRKPRRRLTDAQRRAILAERLLMHEISGDEWARLNDQLDRRYSVLGWALVVCALGGMFLFAAAIIGGAWSFITLFYGVAGTL